MNCGCGPATFRLLDPYIGWDVSGPAPNLVGFDDPAGVQLEPAGGADLIDATSVDGRIPPPVLAQGCGPCDWYLLTSLPPRPARLLRLNRCTRCFDPLWRGQCAPAFEHPVAIAVRGGRLAVSDPGAGTVTVWTANGYRALFTIAADRCGPVAFSPCGDLFVAAPGAVLRCGRGGAPRHPLPAPGEIDRLAVDSRCNLWAVIRKQDGLQLWCADYGEDEFQEATLAELNQAFSFDGIDAAAEFGFCLAGRDRQGFPASRCYSWYGRCLAADRIGSTPPLTLETSGSFVTAPIDSGIPRCQWHRVQIDADVPTGTGLEIELTTLEDPAATPHPADWWQAPSGALDSLVDQPPGRYILARVTFSGNGTATPVVRRVRLDFPRVTSLDLLPAIYRENPIAEDFSERFLSLFDASMAELDRAIERYPALLDANHVPGEVLPWLGKLLDIAADPAWNEARRRTIILAAPTLYRLRGTVAGLKMAVGLVFDLTSDQIVVDELSAQRAWGALGYTAQVGSVRLFGKAKARFILGASPIGGAPIRSFGNPEQDPLYAEAYRFRLSVPPLGSDADEARLRALVEAQKPAHTMAIVRVGGKGFVAGSRSTVGVDTVLASLPPVVLGRTRLMRQNVLEPGAAGCRQGISAGRWTAGANQMLME
jgi:phage tail-like protein